MTAPCSFCFIPQPVSWKLDARSQRVSSCDEDEEGDEDAGEDKKVAGDRDDEADSMEEDEVDEGGYTATERKAGFVWTHWNTLKNIQRGDLL